MNVRQKDGCCAIKIAGEMTIYQASELNSELQKLVAECHVVELDLQDVTELDTSGVQILLVAKRAASALKHKFTMKMHSSCVVEIFELLNISHEFGDPIVLSGKSVN